MDGHAIDLSILIPALNEEGNLRVLLLELWDHLQALGVKSEILVVDGGSSDGTVGCAERYGARIVCQKEPGYGRALREGFTHAQGRYVVTMDADFSHRPVFLEDFWRHREEADLLIASRYIAGGSSKTGLFRKALSLILNRVYTRLLASPSRISPAASGCTGKPSSQRLNFRPATSTSWRRSSSRPTA